MSYDGVSDVVNWEMYFDNLYLILDELIRVLIWGGRLIVNIAPLPSDYIPTHHFISNYLLSKKLIWKGEILWGEE